MLDPSALQRFIVMAGILPRWMHLVTTTVLVLASLGVLRAMDGYVDLHASFLLPLPAIIAAALLFDRWAGLFATVLATAALLIEHRGTLDAPMLVSISVFAVVAALVAGMVEALHQSVVLLEQSTQAYHRAERRRSLLLDEFRHRSRNDLQSLAALLQLRARIAPSAAAGEALREAATHAVTLARVQAWLAPRATEPDDPATVDTCRFVEGLAADLRISQAGVMRPVSIRVRAEAHGLDSERALQLGLVLNELVVNALRYAFPQECPGTVFIEFRRDDADFVLSVADDGVGLPDHATLPAPTASRGLGARLLAGLAAQLSGTLRRGRPSAGGSFAELRFPVGECPGTRTYSVRSAAPAAIVANGAAMASMAESSRR